MFVNMHKEKIFFLIGEVKKRRLLWDKNNAKYNDRPETEMAWASVASAVGITIAEAKFKWKNLRDTFRRELRRLQTTKTSSGELNCKSKWRFFLKMLFLAEIWEHNEPKRRSFGAAETYENFLVDSTEDADDLTRQEVMFAEAVEAELGNTGDGEDSLTKTKPVGQTLEHKIADATDCEDTRKDSGSVPVPRTNCDDGDEDLNFFKSLLPHMRTLQPLKKLMVRSEFQNILIRELSAQQSCSCAGNSSSLAEPRISSAKIYRLI